MKSIVPFSILLALFITAPTLAQKKRIKLDSQTSAQQFNVGDYTAIAASSDFEVEVYFSNNKQSVEVEANNNLMEFVEAYVKNNTLYLETEKGLYTKGRMILKATVYASPDVNSFKASSDAKITVTDRITADDVTIRLSSDAVFYGEIASNSLDFAASSDAVADINGSVQSMNAKLSSDSQLDGDDLQVEDLVIRLNGDSVAEVNASKSLDAAANGDSMLKYSGNPKIIQLSARGDSDIKRTN